MSDEADKNLVGFLVHVRRLCDVRGDADGLLRRIKAEITQVLDQIGTIVEGAADVPEEREPTDREISIAMLSELRRIRRCLTSRKPESSAGGG